MSRVYRIAADKPLPLCDCRSVRTRIFRGASITMECGFAVEEHDSLPECGGRSGLC